MATVAEVISRAISLLGIRQLADPPSAEESDAALDAIQSVIMEMIGSSIGGPMDDVVVSSNYEAKENERVTDTSGTATITRPTTVVDALTGATRPPIEGSVIQVAGGATYVYVRMRQAWVQVNALTTASTQPFGAEFDRHLAAVVAVAVAPVLQTQPSDMVQAMADAGRRAIAARFGPRLRGGIDRGLLRRGVNYNVYTDAG